MGREKNIPLTLPAGTDTWLVMHGLPYLDLQQSRPWSSSLQGSDFHQKACQHCREQLRLIPRRSCNDHRRLILATAPLLCSLISCDRGHIHSNIKIAVYRARKGIIQCFNTKKKAYKTCLITDEKKV